MFEICFMLIYVLVGGIPTPLKNMSSSVGMIIPNYLDSHKIPWFQTTNQCSVSVLKSVSFDL